MKKLISLVLLMSLFSGVSSVSAITTFKEPPFQAYKVTQGDSFWFIANRYGLDYKKLMELNPTVDPMQMKVGSVIQLKPASQSTPTPTPPTTASSALSAYEQQVVTLVNQERAKVSLPALKVDAKLSEVAGIKSQDMKNLNTMSHDGTYGSPFDMMKHFGVTYKSAGENIAQGQTTPAEVMKAWMNSPGHKANILSKNFTHIGVGHVASGNYWTQQFIGK
ncbi:CAP domain-containing protein [Paenisporosarcina sp. FSL H8-0542]|uniref:CAP domain-containing protein n=1 Tax=unclassified Paenisporosarcina TaxID=2642018 RepID=UPI00034E365F|nr:CAP domain-containing protein [Paenisporosarcina sp. HGH0030]EPD53309.1 hypothetical protein HMPREF1210_01040 [Paenisporosarcina sp. HGH0030]